MKKFLFLTLLFTTVVETSNVNPTLTTLVLKSSEILTDSEGSLPSYTKPLTKLEYTKPSTKLEYPKPSTKLEYTKPSTKLESQRVQYYSNEYNSTIEIYELEPTQKYELFQIGEMSFLVLGILE